MSEWLWTIDPQDWMLKPRPTVHPHREDIRRELAVRRPPLLQTPPLCSCTTAEVIVARPSAH